MTMEEQFKKWWASQDTEVLSISAKYAAWNGWRAAALQASAPEELKIAAFDAECWRYAVANNVIGPAGVANITSEVRSDMNLGGDSK